MKKMLVVMISLMFVSLFAGCLQQPSSPGSDGQSTTPAQECMKTPNMEWCDKDARCINPATEDCT